MALGKRDLSYVNLQVSVWLGLPEFEKDTDKMAAFVTNKTDWALHGDVSMFYGLR